MHLIVFDVDGTLVESDEFDGVLYAKAVRDVLDIDVDEDWSSYRHVTDSGILEEILDRHAVEMRLLPRKRTREVPSQVPLRDGVGVGVPRERSPLAAPTAFTWTTTWYRSPLCPGSKPPATAGSPDVDQTDCDGSESYGCSEPPLESPGSESECSRARASVWPARCIIALSIRP